MKLYVLKKDIEHPRYTCMMEAGKLIPESRLKIYGFDPDQPRFNEFFEISKTHKVEHCAIVSIDD
jgi:hypothetical protein